MFVEYRDIHSPEDVNRASSQRVRVLDIPHSGVPRNFFSGGGSTNSVENRTERTGRDLGAVAP